MSCAGFSQYTTKSFWTTLDHLAQHAMVKDVLLLCLVKLKRWFQQAWVCVGENSWEKQPWWLKARWADWEWVAGMRGNLRLLILGVDAVGIRLAYQLCRCVSKTFSLLGCDKTNSVVVFSVVFSMGTNHQARVIPKREGCASRTATRRPYLKWYETPPVSHSHMFPICIVSECRSRYLSAGIFLIVSLRFHYVEPCAFVFIDPAVIKTGARARSPTRPPARSLALEGEDLHSVLRTVSSISSSHR